jgi:hypothetical protein
MAEKPVNEKLWTMVIFQAKLKYHPYPSPGASAWVHQRYIELGGKFEDSNDHTRRKRILQEMYKRRLKEKRAHNDHDARDHKKDEGKKKHGDK